jgi:esterase/lipase superfamily enzyme
MRKFIGGISGGAIFRSALIVFAVTQYGCNSHKLESIDTTQKSPRLNRGVSVVFGTDRKREVTDNLDDIFGPSREKVFDDNNSYYAGVVFVSIPEDHTAGSIETPQWYNFYDRDDPSKYMLLMSVDTVKANAFVALKEMISRSDSSDAFIFVHGFNTTFSDAAKRTAQMAFDLSFKGCPIMFSWPSNGKTLQYVSDYDNVDWAIPHLKRFIEDVIEKGKPKKLHLIAHSMGNRLLTNVLKELEGEHHEVLFNQIILAAPDIDASIFKRSIAPGNAELRKASHDVFFFE